MQINALVVDDSGIMRKLVMRSLRESQLAEFTFVEAVDGADALTKFDPATINMVFADWNMPNMSGIDMVRKIREQYGRDIPIVMITTENTMAKVEEAMDQAGADCFIVKPFTSDSLQKKLEPLFTKITETASKGGGFFSSLIAKLS
jgi:two-component system, chemotaxis family, chemotaxis protein CheY